jgi:hypothetical protein
LSIFKLHYRVMTDQGPLWIRCNVPFECTQIAVDYLEEKYGKKYKIIYIKELHFDMFEE